VQVRDLFFSHEKLRALWRVLLFFLLAAVMVWAVGQLVTLLAPSELNDLWQLTISNVVLAVGLLAASALMMRSVERRPVAALGLPAGRDAPRSLIAGFAIGGGFIAAVVVAQTLIGWLEPVPDSGSFGGWLGTVTGLALMLFLAAVSEELLFRGYAFQVLVEGLGVVPAVTLSAGVFGLGHLFNPEVGAVAVLNIGLAGVLLAGAYLKTRSLWTAIGLHWAWNWVMAAVFDLPVSGITFDVPGYDTVELGPDRLTGGSFGPEGGLVTTLLLLPLIVWVYRTSRLQESPRMAALRPLVDSRTLP
jgi:membrane protease YdiL (CAAX protease family)